MGSVTYNFLANSLLFDKKNIETKFKDVSINRLEQELFAYRNHCIQNYGEIIKEINTQKSFLNVFSSARKTDIKFLKQTALYIEQFIVADPLFDLTYKSSDISNTVVKFLGYGNNSSIDKMQLSEICNFLKQITPMVASNFVKLFPLSYHFEKPSGYIPLTMPQNYNQDILPKEILDFFWENVIVKTLKKDGNRMLIEDKLYPSRSIAIDFAELGAYSNIFNLFESQIEPIEGSPGKFKMIQTIPPYPPDEPLFNAWIKQSVNASAKSFFDILYTENYIASNLNSTYLCDSQFKADLIAKNFTPTDDIQTYTANQIMNFDLPFIDNIEIKQIMSMRDNEDIFTLFRVELEKHIREIRNITDEKQRAQKMENIFHELNSVQVQKINQKVNLFRKQMAVSAIVGIAGLIGCITANPFSLSATAVALAKGYKDYFDYREKVIENPAYLLWKVKKK